MDQRKLVELIKKIDGDLQNNNFLNLVLYNVKIKKKKMQKSRYIEFVTRVVLSDGYSSFALLELRLC